MTESMSVHRFALLRKYLRKQLPKRNVERAASHEVVPAKEPRIREGRVCTVRRKRGRGEAYGFRS